MMEFLHLQGEHRAGKLTLNLLTKTNQSCCRAIGLCPAKPDLQADKLKLSPAVIPLSALLGQRELHGCLVLGDPSPSDYSCVN